MDCLQNAESSKIFEDFVVQGQGLEVQGHGLEVQGQGLEVQGHGLRTAQKYMVINKWLQVLRR